jgi:predicted DNA-binding protein with PD1-like motif
VKAKLLGDSRERTWALVFDIGDPVIANLERFALTGNIARQDDEPKVHAHLIVGRRDGSTRGGHLREGHVRPTLEVILTEEPGHLVRRYDGTTGLALIDL